MIVLINLQTNVNARLLKFGVASQAWRALCHAWSIVVVYASSSQRKLKGIYLLHVKNDMRSSVYLSS